MTTENLPTFQTSRNKNQPTEDASETPTTSSSSSDDGSHLDNLKMPDLENEGHDPDAPFVVGEDGEPVDDAPPEQITREAFWVVFQTAFNLPGQILPDLRPMGIAPAETDAAQAASDAVYSLLEIYYPSALMPQSETMAHLMVAAPFFIGKAMVVREIIRAKKAKPVQQEPPAQKREAKPAAEPDDMQAKGDDWHLPGQAA